MLSMPEEDQEEQLPLMPLAVPERKDASGPPGVARHYGMAW